MRAITRTWLTEEQRAKHAKSCRDWRQKNHERSNEIARKSRERWRVANPGLAKSVQAENRYRIRREVLELIGNGRCAKCGFEDWRALHLDHINGGGNRDRVRGLPMAVGLGLWKFRALILSDLAVARAKYQVLCANCNWIKRHEAKECRGIAH